MNDTVVIRELIDCCFSNVGSESEVGLIRGGAIEFDKATDNDTLVVGPRCLKKRLVMIRCRNQGQQTYHIVVLAIAR